MKKKREVEEMIKRAIRDELALRPLTSIGHMRTVLHSQGYFHIHGALDWHYVSKLTKQVRLENLAELYPQDRSERLAMLKERHRVLTEKLSKIVDGEPSNGFDKPSYPTHGERIAAANTILKWDTALFFMEEQVRAIDAAKRREAITVPVIMELPPARPYRQTRAQELVQNHIALQQDRDT